MLYFERQQRKKGFDVIVGIDEAGRGPLAGPVVAAAVCLKNGANFNNRIDDSKKLSPRQREVAYSEIIEKSIFGIAVVNEKIIDELNILVATRIAMEEATSSLLSKVSGYDSNKVCLLIDGNVKLNTKFPYLNIIRGDSRSKSIACGSILAKVTRDRIMDDFDKVFPQYGFLQHKGYSTLMHRKNIKKFGLSQIHRKTFCCV